jgi:DNA-binding transcriptional ArsR family regulator
VETLLKSLAEPRRAQIVRLTWSHELAANEIAGHFPEVTRSAISQHVGVLVRSGLLFERRDGTRRLYRANHREVARVRDYLESFWSDSLERLRGLAESDERTGGAP